MLTFMELCVFILEDQLELDRNHRTCEQKPSWVGQCWRSEVT